MTAATPDPLDRIAPWSRPGCSYPGCSYPGCGTQATASLDGIAGRRCRAHPPTLDRLEQVDPMAAFRLARAWFAWHADERFQAAVERVTS